MAAEIFELFKWLFGEDVPEVVRKDKHSTNAKSTGAKSASAKGRKTAKRKEPDEDETLAKLHQNAQRTPEQNVQAFRRYVERKMMKYGSSSYYMADTWDKDYFSGEAQFMKDLEVAGPMHVKITRNAHYLHEMTDEQILCYYSLVHAFQENQIPKCQIFYARYYMLEVANQIYQNTAAEAWEALLVFWTRLRKAKKLGVSDPYFINLCSLFSVAHPELAVQVADDLAETGCREYGGRLYAQIKDGDYSEAGQYVRSYARLLKAEEMFGEEEFRVHTWKAFPEVFAALEEAFGKAVFCKMVLDGRVKEHWLDTYPVGRDSEAEAEDILVTDYCTFRYKLAGRWVRTGYELSELAQDFLKMVHLYTESFFREYFLCPKRKRSAARVLGKSYVYTSSSTKMVERAKKMLEDPRFEQAIAEGVREYIRKNQIVLPVKEKKKTKSEELYEMDHEGIEASGTIDLALLAKARQDAESVLSMLHDGEIDYTQEDAARSSRKLTEEEAGNVRTLADGNTVNGISASESAAGRNTTDRNVSETERHGAEMAACRISGGEKHGEGKFTAAAECTEGNGDSTGKVSAVNSGMAESAGAEESENVIFTPEEQAYLHCLLAEDVSGARTICRTARMPENVMFRNINQKALDLFEDVLLERTEDGIEILEDYRAELERRLG